MLATILQIPDFDANFFASIPEDNEKKYASKCTIEKVQIEDDTAIITIDSDAKQGKCPRCQHLSTSVHSYYSRHPDDLPLCGLRVQIQLRSKRFRCLNEECPQKTFCARLEEWLPVYARRTKRLSKTLYEAGIMAGGQVGSSLLHLFRIIASRDTVLRTLRREPLPEQETPRVLGIDDHVVGVVHAIGLCVGAR